MEITIFLSFSVLLLLSFIVTKRGLHLFEGMILWSCILILEDNNIWILGMNYKLLHLPDNVGHLAAYDSIRSIMNPIVILLFFELHAVLDRLWSKLLCWIGVIHVLIGIDYATSLSGILQHTEKWKLWYSYLNWTSIVILAYIVHLVIRRVARKDVIV